MRTSPSARRIITIGLACIALTAGAAWIVEESLIQPHRVVIGPAPADLPFEDVAFPSASGSALHGWYAAGCPGHGAVLLLHGVRANRLAMLPRARWLHRLGYGVLLIDFQASGESSGRWITFGAYEAGDAAAATAYLHSRSPAERIAVIGTSMGGASALLAVPPLPVDAMVLEQVYPDIQHAIEDRLRLHLGGGARLAPWMLRWFTWRTGVHADSLHPIDHVAHVTVPKLLIAGSADQHTRLGESMAMYQAAALPKELWVVPGARHVDLYRYDPVGYERQVGGFLARQLGPFSMDSTCPTRTAR